MHTSHLHRTRNFFDRFATSGIEIVLCQLDLQSLRLVQRLVIHENIRYHFVGIFPWSNAKSKEMMFEFSRQKAFEMKSYNASLQYDSS